MRFWLAVSALAPIIVPERADSADAKELIAELEPRYPEASRHGYSVEKLLREAVAFFVTRHDGMPAGCGGVQFFGADYGEIKRMYVRPGFRGQGCPAARGCAAAIGNGDLSIRSHRPVRALRLPAHRAVWGLPG